MKSKPFVSVIVPIYNVEQYLAKCLDSILDAKQGDFDVVLVNDGSTDRSAEIAQQYVARYPHIFKLITQPNGGLSMARNTGLEHTRAEWIIFLDSDDYISPEGFDSVLTALKSSASDVVIYNIDKYYEDSGVIENIYQVPNPFAGKGPLDSRDYIAGIFQNRLFNFVTAWDKAYRRACLERLSMRFIPGRIYEDVPFTFTLFLHGIKVEYLDDVVIYYRIRRGSIMSTPSIEKLNHIIQNIYLLQAAFQAAGLREKMYYDYLVMHAKSVVKGKCKVPFSLLFKLMVNNTTLKKKLVVLAIMVENLLLEFRTN